MDPCQKRLNYLRRRIFAWCGLAEKWTEMGAKLWMITLTYRPGEEWKVGDIDKFMRKMKKNKGIVMFAYAWVGELQKRGAVHFHVMVYAKGRIPKPDKSGMWSHGNSKIELARTSFYLLVHTGKEHQKDFDKFPRGMRAFAVWIKDKDDREELKLSKLSVQQESLVRDLGQDQAKLVMDMLKDLNGWEYLGTTWKDLSLVKDAKKNDLAELRSTEISG
jgi:hypothetical protein